MTIEAFINEGLKDLWEKSRDEIRNAKSSYDEFYQKYGHYDNFEDLRNEKDLRNLGDRIKIICKTTEITQIHESDKKTWDFFKRMEKEYRHFLIHIYPDSVKFRDLVRDILLNNELRIYFETVQNVISHFYNQQGNNPPKWLKDNTLYKFSGIEYLY